MIPGNLIKAAILLTVLAITGCAASSPTTTPENIAAPTPAAAPLEPETTPITRDDIQVQAAATGVPLHTPPSPAQTAIATTAPGSPTVSPVASKAPKETGGGADQLSQLNTPEPEPAHSAPEWPETTWLTNIVDSLPLSVAESGVWTSNPVAALESAGLQPPRNAEEWMSWTPERHEAYWEARNGTLETGMQGTMRQFYPDWDETFGFGVWDFNAMAETGEMEWAGFEINVLTGQVDPAKVKEKLLYLGYETRVLQGLEYLALPEGTRPDIDWTPLVVVNGNVRNVFADGHTLLTAPTAERLEQLLLVRVGEIPSLGRHPAFGDLVLTTPDPLFTAILSRKAALEPEHPRFRQYEPQPDWESVGEWTAIAVAFSRPSPEAGKMTLSLWYQGMAEAQGASGELLRRFRTFHPENPEPFVFLQEFCVDHWKTEAVASPRGAVLTISCQRESRPSSHLLGRAMVSALVEGTLAFLVS